jgi:hypothetical protein
MSESNKANLSEFKSVNPKESSPFYYDMDLMNSKLTWRLYDTGSTDLILRGFYSMDGSFGVSHTYSEGLGSSVIDSLESYVYDGVRGLMRNSRDITSMLSNNADWISGATKWLNEKVSSKIPTLDESFVKDLLNRSAVIQQGKESKLYEGTNLSIPQIGNLDAIIWTESEENNCKSAIDKLRTKFLGKFEKIPSGGGGYWEGPNGLEIALDDPLSLDDVKGSFTLHIGPYQFRNILLSTFNWTYSREFARVKSGDRLKTIDKPAYVVIKLGFIPYKYLTPEYLDSVYKPDIKFNM